MSLNTQKSATVSGALDTRITVRQFLDKPVPDDVLRALLEKAMRSPSGGNLQPWKLHVMTGETLEAFKKEAVEITLAGKLEEPTHPAYPQPLWEPQRSWRYKLGEDMYALLACWHHHYRRQTPWRPATYGYWDSHSIHDASRPRSRPSHRATRLVAQLELCLS